MSLSERLQELRKKNEDSQEQLADKLGVSRQAVSKWESGQGSPDLSNVLKISEIYEVSTDYILKGISPVQQPEKTKKRMDANTKKALSILLVVAGVALVTVLLIVTLYFIGRFVFSSN